MSKKNLKTYERKIAIFKYLYDNPIVSVWEIKREFKPISYSRVKKIIEEYIAYSDKNPKYKCPVCGKGRIEDRKYCSKNCFYEDYAKSHWVVLECSNCGLDVSRRRRSINYNTKRNKDGKVRVFCNNKCRAKYIRRMWKMGTDAINGKEKKVGK